MRISAILYGAFTFSTILASGFNNDENEEVKNFERDNLLEVRSVESIEQIIYALNSSGIIWETLDGIAASNASMDNIANTALKVLKGNSLINPSDFGLNITLNTLDLLNKVKESGIIGSTARELLINEQNNEKLANFTINLLVTQLYAPQLLIDLGNGVKLSVDHIASRVKQYSDYEQTNPSSNKGVYFGSSSFKRDDNSGSASAFLNNLIGAVAGLSLVTNQLDDVLTAVNNTGIVADLVLQSLDQTLIGTIIKHVVPIIYNGGGFDKLDIPKLLQETNDKHIMANFIQKYFTDPTWDPAIGKLFLNMQATGLYPQIEKRLEPIYHG